MSQPDLVSGPEVTVRWCDRCGGAVDGTSASTDTGTGAGAGAAEAGQLSGGHTACQAARALEPPRFCSRCRRRMKVQVLPAGWVATCVEHGETRSG